MLADFQLNFLHLFPEVCILMIQWRLLSKTNHKLSSHHSFPRCSFTCTMVQSTPLKRTSFKQRSAQYGYVHTSATVPFLLQLNDGTLASVKRTSDKRTFCLNTCTVWVKKKSPPTVFWNFFPNGWGFLINFLHTYYTIISTLEYKFLFKYLQLWQSYAILSVTI